MILVSGATGQIGSELVKQLDYDGVPVRALVRDPARAAELAGPGVEIVQGDFNRPETLARALEGVERAFLLVAVDPRMVQLNQNFLDAAKKAGVKHVVRLSAQGSAVDSPLVLGRWHGESDRALERSGLDWTVLQPSMFMQNIVGYAGSIRDQGAFYAPMGHGKVGMVDVRDIAEVAVAALTESGHTGQRYAITGPEALSFDDAASKLSHALGKAVRYVDVEPAQARQGMLGSGMPDWFADALLELFAVWKAGHGELVTPVVSDVARKQPITFDEFARDYAPVFGGAGTPA